MFVRVCMKFALKPWQMFFGIILKSEWRGGDVIAWATKIIEKR